MTPDTGLKDTRAPLLKVAEGIIAARKRRSQLFPRSMFSEPAWDILLALYIQPKNGGSTPVSKLEFAGTPQSTLVRWIDYLENEKLVTRVSEHQDPLLDRLSLTDRAFRGLESYLREMAKLSPSAG